MQYTNSLEALEASHDAGFRMVEVDFNWTTDGELALVHDWDVMWRSLFNGTEVPSWSEFATATMKADLTQLGFHGLVRWIEKHPETLVVTDVKTDNLKFLGMLAQQDFSVEQRTIISGAFEIADRILREILVPRRDVLTLATGLAGIFNAWLLWRYVRRAGLHRPRPGWGALVVRLLLACAAMAAIVLAMRGWIGDFRALAGWERFAWLLATVGAGVGGYVVALWMLGMRPADLREH